MKLLTVDQVIELHNDTIEQFGGSHGIRDRGLLESAIAQQMHSFVGEELYPSLTEKAAAIGFSLVANHAFVDGNKRVGLAAIDVLLRANGCCITATMEEIKAIILSVASGATTRRQLTEWIDAHLGEFNT